MYYDPSYSRSDLITIVNKWPELEEISLQLKHPNQVSFLMDNLKHLKRIVINNVETDEDDANFDGLSHKIEEYKDWKITNKEIIYC